MSNHEKSHENSRSSHETWKDKLKGKKAIIAAVAAGILVVGVGGAILINNNGDGKTANQESSQSQDASDSFNAQFETKPQLSLEEVRVKYEESLLRGEALTKKFEIPVGLSDEELAQTVMSRFDDWGMYGADPLLYDEYVNTETQRDSFINDRLPSIAKTNSQYIVPGLFENGWQESQSTAAFVDAMEKKNANNLDFYSLTADGSAGNEEPYRLYREITKVMNTTRGGVSSPNRTLVIDFLEKTNTDKNLADDRGATLITPAGYKQSMRVNFTEIDGKTVITGLTPLYT